MVDDQQWWWWIVSLISTATHRAIRQSPFDDLLCLRQTQCFHYFFFLFLNINENSSVKSKGYFRHFVNPQPPIVFSKTLSPPVTHTDTHHIQAMGLLSWFKGKPQQPESQPKPAESPKAKPAAEVPGMHGAVEVARPADITVFEFGSVAASADKVTLAGYCPVSDDLEPCRWEILPASSSDAPQFRVVF